MTHQHRPDPSFALLIDTQPKQGWLTVVVTSSIGTSEETVLLPFLFTLYTSNFCFNSRKCHLLKFSYDMSVVSCITDYKENKYRDLIRNFVRWWDRKHLQLNSDKTKELILDLRRRKRHQPTVLAQI